MRQTIAIFAVILGLFVLVCGTANAATQTVVGTGTIGSTTTLTINTSSNVQIQYTGTATTFGATADHLSGDKVYGTGSNATGLYYQSKATGGHFGTAPGSIFDSSGWTAQ